MSGNQKAEQSKNREEHIPVENSSNASNPSPFQQGSEQVNDNQLMDKNADKYIREAGNIEDMPDPQEQQEADKILEKGK